MGAKRTSDLIPLCHPLPLSLVDVRLRLDEVAAAIEVSGCFSWRLLCELRSSILFEWGDGNF